MATIGIFFGVVSLATFVTTWLAVAIDFSVLKMSSIRNGRFRISYKAAHLHSS